MLYDIVVSDSKNERYLKAMGKGKKNVWPKSNAEFEHRKAIIRKRICHLKWYLEVPKDKYKEFYGEKYNAQVIDSEDDSELSKDFQHNA